MNYGAGNWRRIWKKPLALIKNFHLTSLGHKETNSVFFVESPWFLPLSFEELQKRSLLRRNCTEIG